MFTPTREHVSRTDGFNVYGDVTNCRGNICTHPIAGTAPILKEARAFHYDGGTSPIKSVQRRNQKQCFVGGVAVAVAVAVAGAAVAAGAAAAAGSQLKNHFVVRK